VRHFPTAFPIVDVHFEQLATVFELADSGLLHLAFQAVHRRETLLRFLQYDVGLYAQYQKRIHTVVIYGAGAACAAETPNLGAVQCSVANVLLGMGRRGGDVSAATLSGRIREGRAEGKREDVLNVLTKRLSAAPPTLAEQLLQVSDVERLDVLLDAVLAAQSLEKFVQTLNNSLTP
jgi:hypothetical protein